MNIKTWFRWTIWQTIEDTWDDFTDWLPEWDDIKKYYKRRMRYYIYRLTGKAFK